MATTKIIPNVLELNPGDPENVLKATNAVTVSNASGSNKYYFDGVYDGKFGLRIGTTVLTGVPSGHPIAIINNGKTSQISYTGTTSAGTGTGPDGNTYTFYYGDITITVSADFGTVSYYCLNHGYMGGQDNLVSVYSEAGLKMPTGTAFSSSETAEEGMMRNDTSQSSDGSASTMQHYNGTNWKNFSNKVIITPVTDNLLYEVKAESLTDGSNTGPVTWSDESGNGNDWLIGQALNTGTSAVNTFTVNKADKYFECSPGSLSSGTGTGIETVSAIDLTVDCTVEMWLYITGYTSSGYVNGFITYNYNGSRTGMYQTLVVPTTYYASLALYAGASSVYNVSSNYATTLNTWNQHVFTIDDTNNETKFYKNGALIVTHTSSISYTSANDIAALGYPDYGSTQGVEGRVGILRGYTDVLTADEVLQNYNANKADYGLS